MDNKTIQVARDALKRAPTGVYVQRAPKEPVKPFYSDTSTGVADVFEQATNEGYKALFMPELAVARIGSDELWQKWYTPPSLKATGKTSKGSNVVVYAHVPHYFSSPANIRDAIKNGTLKNGTGAMPQEAFDSLVAQDGNGRVFVVDYDTLRKSTSNVIINVDAALEHPQTIPFLGGEAIAQAYLAKHKEVYGNRIGVWHSDDFDTNTPRGRVLFLGYGDYGLGGDGSLGGGGRVLGVAPEAQSVEKNNGANVPLEQRVELLENGNAAKIEGRLYVLAPQGLKL